MGDSISEGTVQEFTKSKNYAQQLLEIGEYVAEDEIIAVVETDKVNVDIRTSKAGIITKFFAEEGDTVEVNADFFEIDTDGKNTGAAAPAAEAPKAAAPTPTPTPAAAPATPATPAAPASPATPVAPVAQAPRASTPPPPPPPKAAAPAKKGKEPTTINGTRTETRVPMSRMRTRIAQRLKDAQNTNAMLTTFNEVDMSAFMDLRKKY
jgi:2-oxoglutarate dehydrogenase E2 component (dihydrolipoamide succinyltransferase)